MEVVEPQRVLVGIVCDTCEKEIKEDEFYYEVVTGHHQWSGDSHESEETKDYCSVKCTSKAMKPYFKELEGEVGESYYFNISKCQF